jgi:hypothetical protein
MLLTATLPSAAKHRLWSLRRGAIAWACTTLVLVAVAPPSSDAIAEEKTLRDQLIGAWTYVSVDAVRADGTRTPMFGANPQGIAIFDPSGRYALINARSGLSKFVLNNRMGGSPEEYKAVVQGSIAHFGRYTVNDADKTITFHIETSTFPNWNGVEQRRPFTLTGDELKWTTPAASIGGSGEIVLRRAKE